MKMEDEGGSSINAGATPDPNDILEANNAIFPFVRKACTSFENLVDSLEGVSLDEGKPNGYDRDAALTTVEEAQSRFKAWAINIAALQRGHFRSSLDFRLKDAKEIRTRIVKVLKDLLQSISSGASDFRITSPRCVC